jgi:hypothetical protein
MTSLKINTIEADTTTTFSQVPSISVTVPAYPSVGTTIPTTNWVQNTINTLLSPYALISSLASYATIASLSAYATVASLTSYALLSSADFTSLSRGSKPVISTTTPSIIYKSGNSTIAGSVANILFDSSFPTAMVGAVATFTSGTATRTCATSAFSVSGFTVYGSAAAGSASWVAFGY